MKRKVFEKLTEWRDRTHRHPLVLRGARQVGKTFLVRELAKEFDHYLEVNFEEAGSVAELFRSKDPSVICELLEARFDVPLVDGKSLLFLDELQDAEPCVLESLRYFYEKRPGLHVVAAGSLLEFLLDAGERKKKAESFSMPVGRIEYMFVGPMDFEEFLLAAGKEGLCRWMRGYGLGDEVPDAFHAELNAWLRKYLVVGGMPAVVGAYLNSGILAAEREQQVLLSTYHDDFPKYSAAVPADLIQKAFRSVPSMLARKFVYSRVDAGVKSRDVSAAVRLLCLARVMARVRHTSARCAPIGDGADDGVFKPLFLDVGLCCRALGLKLPDFLDDGDALLSNHGPICEQFVGQHLLFAGAEYEEPAAYCWLREAPKSQAEVDYIVQSGTRIVPIEVKGGTTGSMKGLHFYLNEKQADFAVRFNADKPSYLKDAHAKDVLGRDCDFRFLSLPLYMIGEGMRLLRSVLKNEALKSFRPGTASSLKSFVLAVCVAAVAAVGAFAVEPEPVAGVYEGAERFSGDYAIEANARGFRALRLDFHRAPRARIRLYARAYPLFLDVGFGQWLDGLVHVDGEVEPEPGLILGNQPTLASGGVQPDGSLRVCVRLTQTPARLDLVFTGKDGVCAVDGTFTHLTNAWHFTGRRRVPALLDGTPWASRRAAILGAFAAREFGVRPVERPADLAFETLGEEPIPQGVRRRVRCSCTGPYGRFSFDFDAFLPKGAKGVASFVAIGLAYGADQPLAHSLPVDEILARGHALVSFRNWDVAEDDPRTCFTSGVFRAFGPRERGPADWGALSAWAWGASRVMDWIETQGEFDAKRVAVVGHSRCGKTALWAGATDARFALVCANDSGTGGARLDHVDLPWAESRTAIRASFPHWFCGAYRTYAEDGAMEDLDQHMLLALVAPRRLAVGSASDDFWAGIPGERAASELAAAVWERLGVRGFGENVLYHVRTGVHGLEPEDWRAYMSALEAGRHAVGAPTGPMADYFREARGKYAEADFAAGTNTVIHAYSSEDPFGRDPKLDLPGAAVSAEMPVVYSVPGLRNVRDIGGWTGLRTGRVFRGSELVWLEGYENGVNPETRRMLMEVMKLKSDLDLRGEAKWGIFDYGNRRFVELQAFGIPKLPHGFPSYLGLFRHPETVASALREFAKDENYPIYVHCAGGADRTGSLILLVEALCGVKECDVDIDYELTSFAVIYGLRHRDEVGRLNWKGFKDELRRRYPADTLNGSVERYVRDLGLTDAEIAAIRRNLMNRKEGQNVR